MKRSRESIGSNSGPYKHMSIKLTTELHLEYLNFEFRAQSSKCQI